MEKLDQELQRRVWQRVQQGEAAKQPPRENLKAWLLLAGENTAAYQQLARLMTGDRREVLHRLARQSRQWSERARGLCSLRGEDVKPVPVQPPKDPPRRALEKCWHRERRLWQEAQSRAADPEWGFVYSRLADQALERSLGILELLGKPE